MLLCLLCAAVARDANIDENSAYHPQIKIGILKRSNECKVIANSTSLVFIHVIGRVAGQSIPIINTYKSKKPIFFKLNTDKIIEGLRQGLIGACLGETRRITIPPALAYSHSGYDGLFPPDSTWIVDAELVDISNPVMY